MPISRIMTGARLKPQPRTDGLLIMPSEPSNTPKDRSGAAGRAKSPGSVLRGSQTSAGVPSEAKPNPRETLERSELRRKALLDSVADLVCAVSKEGVILELHLPKDAGFVLSQERVVGRRVMELLPVQIGQQAMYHLEKALRTGQTEIFSTPYLVSDKTRELQARISPSGPGEAVVIIRDVTVQKLTEKEILEISNREQVRIGQDLHDGLGQHLTGVTFLSKALEKKLAARSLPEAEEAAEIGRLVLQALSQTRNLARGIFPVGPLVPVGRRCPVVPRPASATAREADHPLTLKVAIFIRELFIDAGPLAARLSHRPP